MERRNLELFSPVGSARAVAVEVLRAVVKAIIAGQTRRAAALLDSVVPESPDNSAATVASCIGITLGVLDDALSAPAAPTATLPAGHWTGERAATDILALAAKGKAFHALDKLLVGHGGHQVIAGCALALATTVWAVTHISHTPVTEVVGSLIR